MEEYKIFLEINGRVCSSVEFVSLNDAVQTGSKMLKDGLYDVGQLVVVRVYKSGRQETAAGVPLNPSR